MTTRERTDKAGLVAALGASAGGLEALLELFSRLPRESGLAYLVLLHSKPDHEPLLKDILAARTALKVVEAGEGAAVEPGTIYVMPPGLGVRATGSRLVLASLAPELPGRHPIDGLFGSLAEQLGDRAIGVVLSGTGGGGAEGLKAIKAKGGTALAQAPDSAQFDAMPLTAIARDTVDCVLPPAGLAETLARMDADAGAQAGAPPCVGTAYLDEVFGIVRAATGIDFSLYKSSTIQRRLARRLAMRQLAGIDDYLALLRQEPAEAVALCQDFLIRVTEFFREPELFEVLAAEIFPRLLQERPPATPLRIWVPGCSTGEEVYSIAIALREYLDRSNAPRPQLLLFGSDLSGEAIDRARAGIYSADAVRAITAERRERFFNRLDGQYQIRPEVRDLCVFAKHNVARDPPFSKLDFISCCNLLIYFAPALQRRVIATFHYALNPGGLLRLGSSERVGAQGGKLFCQIDRKRPLYFKREAPIDFPTDFGPITENFMIHGPGRPGSDEPPSPTNSEVLQREIDRLILSDYAPAGFVIDQNQQIVRFTGSVGPYLQPQQGSASLSIGKLLDPALQVAIASAVDEARGRDSRVRREDVRVRAADGERLVNLDVAPLRGPAGAEPCFLVLFNDAETRRDSGRAWWPAWLAGWRRGAEPAADPARLQAELDLSRRDLRGLLDARELDQEELKTVREELLSAREEFQSTNEELETAQEELKSANEELITANEELRLRNAELTKAVGELRDARDYAQAIIEGVRAGLLVLDPELRVRRANRAILDMLRLPNAAVEGQGLADLGFNAPAAASLLDGLKSLPVNSAGIENFEIAVDLPRVGERILIVNARKLSGDGELSGLVLLSLLDVTERRRDEIRLKQQGELLDQAHEAMFVWALGGTIRYWNRGAEELYGYSREEAVDRVSHDLLRTRRSVDAAEFERRLQEDRKWMGEVLHTTRDGRELLMDSRYTVREEPDGSLLVLETNRDITERRQWEEQLRRADRQKDEFLAMLAHELRNPLAPLRNALAVMERADPTKVPAKELRAMMDRQVTKLTRIVDDLLDIARITRGQIELRKEPIDLGALANQAAETARPQVEAAGHRLRLSLPETPVRVDADPVRVEQILENLLSNAVRYTPAGGEIELSLEAAEGEAWLRVLDNGVGVAPEELPHLFDLFVQSDRSLDRRQGGLGIGLTLVRKLAELHGGRVLAESGGVGRGSRFSVAFPLAALAARDEPSPPTPARPTSPLRILVVDDNRDVAESNALVARSFGHEAETAYDGPAALAVAARFRPDVVLLDIGLPGINGYELAARLRALQGLEQVRLVAVSGYGSEQDRAASAAAGIEHHLVKPVAARDLEAAIGTAGSAPPT